jgi:S1-C subfamily serine protease
VRETPPILIVRVLFSMKLRPVLLVVLLLTGFYYATTHLSSTGALAPLFNVMHGPAGAENNVEAIKGGNGTFDLTVASAAPAYDSEEQQNIAVYKKAMPSVVNITSTEVRFDFFYGAVPQTGQGSGFILNSQGLILTNNHVIENGQKVEVTLYNDKRKYKAQVVTVDRGHDLALLKIDAPNLVPATLAETSTGLTVGQRVYAIGNPFGLSGTMTRGIISAIRSVRGPESNPIEDAIQTDASVNPGNSGGPLLNSRGEVIGITTMIASNGADQSSGIGFAIPINTAKAVLDDFAKYGRVRRPSLDIVTLPIGPDVAEQIGLPADYGLLIEKVLPGGAAEKAGLHGGNQRAYEGNTPVMLGGDLIVKFDGQDIANGPDLSAEMNRHRAGDTVTVTVFRGRKRMDFKVTLGDSKDQPQGPQI